MDLLVKVLIDTAAVAPSLDSVKQALSSLEANGLSAIGNNDALDSLATSSNQAAEALRESTKEAKALDAALQGANTAGKPSGAATTSVLDPGLKAIAANSSKAAQGLNAVNSASAMLSGTFTGTVSGAMGLSSALKGMGVAQGGYVAITLAASVAITKFAIDSMNAGAKMRAAIKFDNAQSGIENMRQSFERLMETMNGAISLARELRGITAKSDDLDFEKKQAEMELKQKKELSALDPTDVDGASALRAKHQMERANLDLDRTAGGIGSESAGAQKELEDNKALIAAKQKQKDELLDRAGEATASASFHSSQAAGFGTNKPMHQQEADRSLASAKSLNSEAAKVRSEVEELERKNIVLADQAKLYETRNEIIAIRKEAASMPEPEFVASQKEKNEKGEKVKGEKPLSVESDRLARIGGFVGGSGGQGKLESLSEKQLAESKKTSAAVEKIARVSTGVATWG